MFSVLFIIPPPPKQPSANKIDTPLPENYIDGNLLFIMIFLGKFFVISQVKMSHTC